VAAKAVAALLHPHFASEEEFALPPLGLLAGLAAGKLTPAMHDAIAMSDKLKRELPRMMKEHKTSFARSKSWPAPRRKKKSKIVGLPISLSHAKTEEQVLYPAAILVGEYLDLCCKGTCQVIGGSRPQCWVRVPTSTAPPAVRIPCAGGRQRKSAASQAAREPSSCGWAMESG
jgi:hypothetical protein